MPLFTSDKEITMKRFAFLQAAFAALVFVLVPAAQAADGPQSTTEQIAQLDINSADAELIASALDGIGLFKAREIVAYREMFGNFRSVDELAEVKGVGMVTIDRNRHKILIQSD
jgi:competence protein ComEA